MRRSTSLLVLLLVLVAGARIAMLDRGALAYPDELRYLNSVRANEHLLAGRIQPFCAELSSTDGRPGSAVADLLPAAVQLGLHLGFGRSATDSASLLVPLLLRIAIGIALLVVFHRLCILLVHDHRGLALAGTLVYALLANSNAYVRHLLPYDLSLLLFMVALWLAVRTRGRPGFAPIGAIGLLSGFAFTVYPGYYAFPGIVTVALVVRELELPRASRTLAGVGARALCLGAAALAPPLVAEWIARIGRRSFFGDLSALSGTINQGSFEEGFSFIFKYLIELETVIGVVLLIGAGAYGITLLRALARRDSRTNVVRSLLPWLAATALAAFLYHAAASAILHRMVFYGRLVHMYAPFLVWAALAFVQGLESAAARRAGRWVLVASAVVSFALFARGYYPLAYPLDVIRSHRALLSTMPPDRIRIVQESQSDPLHGDFSRQVRALASSDPGDRDGRRLTIVNLGFFYPLDPADFRRHTAQAGARTVYSAPHWLGHPIYALEGNTIEERRLLRERGYRISLHVLDAGAAGAR